MTLSTETITQLHALIEADASLIAKLKQSVDASASSVLIADAAAAKGLQVNQNSLALYLKKIKDSKQTSAGAEVIDDAQLGTISGSVGQAGYGAQDVYSLHESARKNSIYEDLKNAAKFY